MMIIGVLGQKGGSGKTTLAAALAVAAARRGKAAVLVDADDQGSAAAWGRRRPAGDDRLQVTTSNADGIGRVLDLAQHHKADAVVIDMAGKASVETVKIMRHLDLAVVPVRPAVSDIETLAMVRLMLARAGNREPPALVVLNQAPVRGGRLAEACGVLAELGLSVWPGAIYHRVAHMDAMDQGRTAAELHPEGKAALEIGELYRYIVKLLSPSKPRRIKGQ